jgi:hypothetical protein
MLTVQTVNFARRQKIRHHNGMQAFPAFHCFPNRILMPHAQTVREKRRQPKKV